MERLERIKKRGRLFKFLFAGLFLITPAISVLMWIFYNNLPDLIRVQMMKEYLVTVPVNLAFDQRVYSSLAGLALSCISMAGFYILIKLFSLYEKGIIFSSDNVNCYRKLGYLIIIFMAAGIIHNSAMSVIISLHNPPGQRIITFSLSSSDFALGIIGMIVVLVSWIMDAGREMSDEQEYIV
ncbi:MAG TPA: DUF2975 domain-containing protein [Spirochaetota bacterium]|nr:DUF2975 domain-containing protein [Spirochaetota bacterium]HPS87520.1 DUF2975 domain-containing protein [Spirochaetota bacterium]